MAAGAMTAPQKSASTGGKRSRWKILYILFYLGGAFLAYRYSWNLGTTWLLVGALIFILLLMEPDWRKFSLFLFINVVIATVIASYLQPQFLNNEAFLAFVNQSSILGFLFGGFGASVIWSLVIGAVVALIITGVPLLLLSYAGAVHVLALHQQDGVSRREAMGYVMSLILGINLPYIIV